MSRTKTAAPPHQGGAPGTPGPTPVAPPRALKQRRRRPALIALSLALTAVGGLSGALLFTATGERTDVLAVSHEVAAGEVIEDGDLTEVSISLDPALKPVKAADRGSVVGKRAAVALTPGALLARDQYTATSLLKQGDTLVGVATKPSQRPTSGLFPGRKVLIVSTPGENDEAADAPPQTIAATVVAVGDPADATGVATIDVAVPATDGPALAARAATGRVAIVVKSGSGS
ncbi:SAF domain-containing protein [Streptomyces drozdowiczii]|uniref:SAF domain-containing protein n=1 Tax=Streptomyces drozdowiczii TaxID=202862 RepID=A0ABY6PV37_9ACTN|nr:SAF domain-containing protein [Streptomyces drozdowiczii]UZK55651.1 SAF domain-containing protein [Streptomyces drozdowiczii]